MNELKPTPEGMLNTIEVEESFTLSPLEPSEATAIWEIIESDPEIPTRINWVHGAQDSTEIERRIAKFMEHKEMRYGIFDTDKLVGYIGIWPSTEHNNDYELGYFIDANFRGRRIVPRAVRALMILAVQNLPARSFSLFIADNNDASQKVAQKLGFNKTEEIFNNKVLNDSERRFVKKVIV